MTTSEPSLTSSSVEPTPSGAKGSPFPPFEDPGLPLVELTTSPGFWPETGVPYTKPLRPESQRYTSFVCLANLKQNGYIHIRGWTWITNMRVIT